MGLGGASPLISGICNKKQTDALLSHLKTKGEIWSDIGLSAVDQSAPYFSNNGYWNGTVWMPHQWFFLKTMLDLGESDFAYKIGTITTGFNVWIKEKEFNGTNTELIASLQINENNNDLFTVIVCLNPNYSYNVYWQDKIIKQHEIDKGTLSISVPNNAEEGVLLIRKK
jgi:hypothetical protein